MTINNGGSITYTSRCRGQTESDPDVVMTVDGGIGGEAGFIHPDTASPEEELSTHALGRLTMRDLRE
jgi:hypothetical protein